MKIAFDGTVLYGRKSGVGYYCEELLKAMVAVDHDDEFIVFSHQPIAVDLPSSNGNVRFNHSNRFPIRALYLQALLPRVLNSVQPDLCHYTNFLAPIVEHRPYVVTIHDMGMEVLPNAHPFLKRLYNGSLVPRVARNARLIITNSEYSKWEIVRHLGICEDRIRVTPLAAGPEFVPVARPHKGNPYVLYVGNLEPRKNLERLIEAFARMPRKDHDLVIVGNRFYRGGDAEQKAQLLGLNGRVKFRGYVSRGALPELFSAATAFIYPSLLEGFGLPVVEAMACGAPVITSNNSSMKEIAAGAAVLVNPRNVAELTEALTLVTEDEELRRELSRRGLARAREFSWMDTARLTLAAYRDAMDTFPKPEESRGSTRSHDLNSAIKKTIEYARLFQYPLTPEEIHERLFEVKIGADAVAEALNLRGYEIDRCLYEQRTQREQISDRAIRDVQPHLRTLASMPFVRMIAFSGSTAHRNMTTTEDIDLFMVVEDGKLWALFLTAVLWAKAKGVRNRLCMNYLISDAALPLSEHDLFTAQQAASLKPFYGKRVYDRFLAANPFISRYFPNFDPQRHRSAYPEFKTGRTKRLLEALLRFGPVQIVERISRFVLERYLSGKVNPYSDVQLDRRRLKLHLYSHKQSVLGSTAMATKAGER